MKVRKAANFGKKVVKQAAKRVGNDVRHVIRTRLGSKHEARQFLSAVIAEARQEQSRIAKFAKQEWDREFKKAKPVLKKAAKRLMR
ncbi:MAG TPA: hypothetical protein VJJ82_01925 [Candidatus Nanoarchaeia archaeon]|nr:hypothetical protein [Candidatus Nanoarchaeia archaeon]